MKTLLLFFYILGNNPYYSSDDLEHIRNIVNTNEGSPNRLYRDSNNLVVIEYPEYKYTLKDGYILYLHSRVNEQWVDMGEESN